MSYPTTTFAAAPSTTIVRPATSMTYAAPTTTLTSAPHSFAAPAAAVRTYAAPATLAPTSRSYAAPATVRAAPVTYAAPHVTYAAPSTTLRSAPAHIVAHPAATTYAAPAQITYAAPAAAAPAEEKGGFLNWVKKTFKSACPKAKAHLDADILKIHNKFHPGQRVTNSYCPERPIATSRDIGGPAPHGNVHMLISAIDYTCCTPPWGPAYPGGPGGLDTKFAYDEMHRLVDVCGVTGQVISLFNEQVTKQNLQAYIAQIGSVCQPGDTFIFYYSGHGDHLPDQDGDENDGQDECLCTLGPDGQAEDRQFVWTRDDELAAYITQGVSRDVNIIVIADCCHSGSITDLDKPEWKGFNVVSLSGCTDQQTSAGTGQGGEFTRAMLAAIESFQQRGERDRGVDRLYNMALWQYQSHHTSDHVQDISINAVGKMFRWPLQPLQPYRSPTGCVPGEPPASATNHQVQSGQPQAVVMPQRITAYPQAVTAYTQPYVSSYPQPVVSYPQPAAYTQYQPVAYQPMTYA